MSYTVTAKRWGSYWELHIDGVGVTQSRTLATAERTVREYLALDEHDDADTAEVTITPVLSGNLAEQAEAARHAVRRAETESKAAAQQQRAVAKQLKADGLSGADIATVLGVSTQRVSQLVNSA